MLQAKPRLCRSNGVRDCDNTAGWMCAMQGVAKPQVVAAMAACSDVVYPAVVFPGVTACNVGSASTRHNRECPKGFTAGLCVGLYNLVLHPACCCCRK
jgi:hypothetical protein